MALFKVYYGIKNNLPGELKDSYGYIVTKEAANAGTWIDNNNQEKEYGVGEWYIDTDTKRYRIAAAELVDEEGNLYTLDDLVQKENIVDDLAAAVYNNSSQQSMIPASTQEKLRIGIGVAKNEDSITKAFTITVLNSGWELDQERQGYYKNTVNLSETLHCGAPNATVPVPPLVMWNGIGPKQIYDLFEDVQLNDNKQVITFYIKASDISIVQNQDVGITLVDYR